MGYDQHRNAWNNRYPAIEDLARRARRRIPRVGWEYLSAGTGDEAARRRNRDALDRITFLPRFCKGELAADTATTLFGRAYPAPIGMAPVGLTGLMWPRTEQLLAATAARLGIPFTLSTVATETPESVGPLAGEMGWFQLYPPKDPEIRDSLLARARDSGFHTLVVTADVPMASRRERTVRAGMTMPPRISPRMVWEGITHPAWTIGTLRNGIPRLRTVEHYTSNKNLKFVSTFVGNRMGGTLDWAYCERLQRLWDGPVVLKGVLHPDDAVRAIDTGLDGVWVSNHGGRQFNGAPAAIDALPGVAAAVGGRVPVLFDGGVRSGLDAMRGLYLGADFVFAGRPFVYGVCALGTYGGDHAARILIDDLANNMVQLGAANLAELRRADRFGA